MIRGIETTAKTYKPFDPKTFKGVYVSVVPDAAGIRLLSSIGDTLGLNLTPKDTQEFHCTVMYSKVTPSGIEGFPLNPDCVYRAQIQGVEWWPGHDNEGYCVLRIACRDLVDLHYQLRKLGCTNSFGDYLPHMTIKKDVGEMPSNFHALRAKVNRDIGRFINLSSARLESLK